MQEIQWLKGIKIVKIKKFTARTEQDAIEKVKDELGMDALVVNIKKIQPAGLFAMFKKTVVEVTAAYEEDAAPSVTEKPIKIDKAEKPKPVTIAQNTNVEVHKFEAVTKDVKIAAQDDKIKMLQDMLYTTGDMLARAQEQLAVSRHRSDVPRKYQNNLVQIFYDTMLNQDVREEVASYILRDLEGIDETSQIDVRFIVKTVYGSILEILKNPTLIETAKNKPQTIVFMGPTGVGKTTTIAKLSSILSIKHGLRLGLITADTYRVAAVEQLRIYADILGIELRVVYAAEEMRDALEALRKKCDIILVDTAGRSHRNKESLGELESLLSKINDAKRYLVLSVTTKYDDLCKITSAYDSISDFDLIFTKLDEADHLGSIINICCLAAKKVAYVTFGQNVPDDIEAVKADKIAKSLLGLTEGLHPYMEGGQPA